MLQQTSLVILASVFLGSLTHAAARSNETSLRELALKENKNISQNSTQTPVTDAQVTGFLTLKDPRPEIITRTWKYHAGVRLQYFQAEGQVVNDSSQKFELSNTDTTVMPGLEFGISAPEWTTGPVAWTLGARFQGSFASQDNPVVLSSGFEVSDARLNSTMVSAGPTAEIAWKEVPWLSLAVSPQFGGLNYTQTSSNDVASFSKHAGFQAWHYGFNFQFSRRWSLSTEWINRQLNDSNNTIALQENGFELGTKVTW